MRRGSEKPDRRKIATEGGNQGFSTISGWESGNSEFCLGRKREGREGVEVVGLDVKGGGKTIALPRRMLGPRRG